MFHTVFAFMENWSNIVVNKEILLFLWYKHGYMDHIQRQVIYKAVLEYILTAK